MSRTARRVLPLIALVAALVVPAHAGAVGIGDAYRDYAADGSLDACKYSAAELQALLSSVPTDIAQYDPRFVDELNRALDARASGACSKKKKGKGGGDPATVTSGGGSGGGTGSLTAADGSPKPLAAPQQITSAAPAAAATPDLGSDRGFPTALGVLAAVLGLVLLGTAGLVARRNGWSPGAFLAGIREGFGR